MTWLQLAIYGLACFRLAVLTSIDSGPWKFAQRFRAFLRREEKTNKALKKSDMAHGVECLRCSSLELALPLALFAYYHGQLWAWLRATGDLLVLSLALSALAILFHRAFPAR